MHELTQFLTELLDWLHELQLDMYSQNFVKEELFLDILADIEEKTLEKMGIATGHRLKIIKACKVLKGNLPLQMRLEVVTRFAEKKTKELKERKEEEVLGDDVNTDHSEAAVSSLRESLLALKHSGMHPPNVACFVAVLFVTAKLCYLTRKFL